MVTNVGPGDIQPPESGRTPPPDAAVLERFASPNGVAERTVAAIDQHAATPTPPPSETGIKSLIGILDDIGLRSGELEAVSLSPEASSFTHLVYGHLAEGTTKANETLINEFSQHHGSLLDTVLKLQASILISN